MSKRNSRMTRAVFELADAALDDTLDVYGVWKKSPPARQLAFATGTRRSTRAPAWRVNLPANYQEAAVVLADLRTSVAATLDALTQAQARLHRFVVLSRHPPKARKSFATALANAPEAELTRLLASLQVTPTYFGLAGLFDNWKEATQEFLSFVQQVQQHLSYYAWVETRLVGERKGMTIVTWLGDFNTAFAGSLSREQIELHQQALTLVLASRQQLLRKFVVVAQGAAELAKLAALASNPVLALPAALRFVKFLLAEYRKANKE